MSLLKNVWTAVVNVGWVAVVVFAFNKAPSDTVAQPSQTAVTPTTSTEVAVSQEQPEAPIPEPKQSPPVEVEKIADAPIAKLPSHKEMMQMLEKEANEKQSQLEEMRRLKDEIAKQPHPESQEPDIWAPMIHPGPAPNMHETHEPGEPYVYSVARQQNNELRWTINEFRWRLRDPSKDYKEYWDLTEVDEPLGGNLPRKLDDLYKQNWELAWRAEQFVAIFNHEKPSGERNRKMPPGTTRVPIPRPSCSGEFCRLR